MSFVRSFALLLVAQESVVCAGVRSGIQDFRVNGPYSHLRRSFGTLRVRYLSQNDAFRLTGLDSLLLSS